MIGEGLPFLPPVVVGMTAMLCRKLLVSYGLPDTRSLTSNRLPQPYCFGTLHPSRFLAIRDVLLCGIGCSYIVRLSAAKLISGIYYILAVTPKIHYALTYIHFAGSHKDHLVSPHGCRLLHWWETGVPHIQTEPNRGIRLLQRTGEPTALCPHHGGETAEHKVWSCHTC